MTLEPFRAAHLEELDLQPAQASWARFGSPAYAQQLEQGLAGYTARTDRVVACGGILPIDADAGHLWGFVGRDASRHLVALHKIVLRLFEVCDRPLIVATTESDFAPGCRWLELMGFRQHPDLLAGYGPDGRDHLLYIRGAH